MPMWREAVGLVFSIKAHEAYYVPVPENQDHARALIHEFKDLLESKEILWVGQNAKYDSTIMKWCSCRNQWSLF